jgi:NADH-quinone oxidoreductase subunit J
MPVVEIIFYIFAAILTGAAIMVISVRNAVYAALFLVLTVFCAAGLWMLLEVEFLAIILILVYVGAVMVLFLFVVMMLDVNVEEVRKSFTRYLPLGAAVALIVVLEIGHVIWFRSQGLQFLTAPQSMPADYSNTKELGAVLYTEHVYAFEIASMVLLLAIVAAITLTMRRRPGLKVQDIRKQVSVRREDRVRIVKVESSKEP